MSERTKIISDGQTGVSRAALNVALELGLPCGGWCPKGRAAEDGLISTKYPLFQTASADNHEWTDWNVRDTNASLVLTFGKPVAGTSLTIEKALNYGRPCLVVDLLVPVKARIIRQWIADQHIQTLNVAGPPASQHPEAYQLSAEFLRRVFGEG